VCVCASESVNECSYVSVCLCACVLSNMEKIECKCEEEMDLLLTRSMNPKL